MPEKVAVYIRLSRADEDVRSQYLESQSVSNQRKLAYDFIRSHPELSSYEIVEYVDDGFSGTSDDRPQFQKLLSDIKASVLKIVVVKDFSRFARDYILMGDLLEQVFPFLRVRFISINDHYDSAKDYSTSDSITVVLKSILNSQFSRDLSAKQTSTHTILMQRGDFSFRPPYGYIRYIGSAKLQIDPEAAAVVQLVFRLALSGHSTSQIAEMLNLTGIPTPGTYFSVHGWRNIPEAKQPLWGATQVLSILRNYSYTGTMVFRKRTKVAPCSRYYRNTEPSEQIVRENTFIPLVSKKDFEKVHALVPKINAPQSRTPRGEPLQGILRCGYCGNSISIEYRKTAASPLLKCRRKSAAHTGHLPHHHLKPVEDAVYPLLLNTFDRILAEEQEAAQGLAQAPKRMDQLDREIARLQKKRENLAQQKYQIYEDYCAGKFSCLGDYMVQKKTIADQCHEVENQVNTLREKRTDLSNSIIPDELRRAAAAVNQYRNAKSLERGLAQAFIESIGIYDDHMEIRWRFHDLFSRIAPETVKPIPYSKEETP